MKVRRRHRVAKHENDEEWLIDDKNEHEHEHSTARRILWKLVKGTWKALKIGFKTAAASQPFSVALEPTALATTIYEYRMRPRDYR